MQRSCVASSSSCCSSRGEAAASLSCSGCCCRACKHCSGRGWSRSGQSEGGRESWSTCAADNSGCGCTMHMPLLPDIPGLVVGWEPRGASSARSRGSPLPAGGGGEMWARMGVLAVSQATHTSLVSTNCRDRNCTWVEYIRSAIETGTKVARVRKCASTAQK